MDAVGLVILELELAEDAVVLREAATKARQRLNERAGGFAEACAANRAGVKARTPLGRPTRPSSNASALWRSACLPRVIE